jgi:hypothetical protein
VVNKHVWDDFITTTWKYTVPLGKYIAISYVSMNLCSIQSFPLSFWYFIISLPQAMWPNECAVRSKANRLNPITNSDSALKMTLQKYTVECVNHCQSTYKVLRKRIKCEKLTFSSICQSKSTKSKRLDTELIILYINSNQCSIV